MIFCPERKDEILLFKLEVNGASFKVLTKIQTKVESNDDTITEQYQALCLRDFPLSGLIGVGLRDNGLALVRFDRETLELRQVRVGREFFTYLRDSSVVDVAEVKKDMLLAMV
jgi:hypothetical protein